MQLQQQHVGMHTHVKQPALSTVPRPAAPVRHTLRCHAKQQQKDAQKTDSRSKLTPSSLNGKQGIIQPQKEEQVCVLYGMVWSTQCFGSTCTLTAAPGGQACQLEGNVRVGDARAARAPAALAHLYAGWLLCCIDPSLAEEATSQSWACS